MDDELGVVQDVGIRATVLRTIKDVELIVPNSQFLTNVVTNYSRGENRAIRLEIQVFTYHNRDPLQVREARREIAVVVRAVNVVAVVERDGVLIMVDDERLPLKEGEKPEFKKVRFRTLGCYPLTGAVESNAETVEEIVQEMLLTTTSERQGRVIDDDGSSMEDKKKDGYF